VHLYYSAYAIAFTQKNEHEMTTILLSTRPATAPVADQRTVHLPLYKVLLHNDDVNSMEHVVQVLRHVFKFDRQVCNRIMIEAHRNGVALCTIEPVEQAELHRDQLISFSLVATIEPE
jgi:ATP-dependent Clp protease adaptor protein ClpS